MAKGPYASLPINGLTDFGSAWVASGTQGFFGELYSHQKIQLVLYPERSSLHGATFVAKTATLEDRLDPANGKGNMHLHEDGITPRQKFPRCIIWNPLTGDGLNVVGLSGMSLERRLATGILQERTEPFMISVMAVSKTRKERIFEIDQMVRSLAAHKDNFKARRIAIQDNVSCPNVNVGNNSRDRQEFISEANERSDLIVDRLGWPQIKKLAVSVHPQEAFEIGMHRTCHAISPTNTIPWGAHADIPWERLFGLRIGPFAFSRSERSASIISPFVSEFGENSKGGLSGPRLRPIALRLIRVLRKMGFNKHINGGGGITHPRHVLDFAQAGADSISIGTGSWYGWHNQSIIKMAHEVWF